MQNDIVKPPAQPSNLPKPESKPVGNEVHSQPGVVDHPAPAHPLPTTADKPQQTNHEAPDTTVVAKKPRSNKPIGAIVAAAIVFLGLAGGAVYMTLQKDNKQPAASNTQTQQPAASTTADAGSDIDDALNDAAQLPTSNEDPANDLSDPSLGL